MNIQNNPNINFKGYDARRLKGFFMGTNSGGIIESMQCIGRKEDFKIYSKLRRGDKIICDETIPDAIPLGDQFIWAQDIWTFTKDKLLTTEHQKRIEPICERFNLPKIDTQKHISGGNIFITDNNGVDELFIGEDELKKISIAELRKKYGVNKIHILPQMDYHLDLFIRPLDNKRILIADDNLTLQVLEKGKKQFEEFTQNSEKGNNPIAKTIRFRFNHLINSFKKDIRKNDLPQTEEIEKILLHSGYEPIRVPGRFYRTSVFTKEMPQTFLSHDCNYMNANVLKNKDGDIVYITNKSNLDRELLLTSSYTDGLDFSFEKEFVKSLEPYVKPEKVYFIDGNHHYISEKMLKDMQGGIHCACSEIPM